MRFVSAKQAGEELARRHAAGDQERLVAIMAVRRPCWVWGHRAGLSSEDAADLAQEVLTLLVQKLPEFHYDRTKSFRGWLRQVTRNKWQERRRRLVPVTVGEGDGWLEEVEGPPAEEFWEADYREFLVARALEVMRADFETNTWRACWEHVVSGRPAREVGRELGMTVGAVYVAKCRVLARLREELEGLVE